MLGDISLATNIYLVTGYTDMRKFIDGFVCNHYEKISNRNLMDIPSICSAVSVATGTKSCSNSRMAISSYTKDWMFNLEDTVGQGTVPR